LEKEKAIESLKVNASLDVVMIHHRSWEEVGETGLGFDNIDMLVIEDRLTNNKDAMKAVKRYKRKGYIDKIKII
jgi:hypothetical protein